MVENQCLFCFHNVPWTESVKQQTFWAVVLLLSSRCGVGALLIRDPWSGRQVCSAASLYRARYGLGRPSLYEGSWGLHFWRALDRFPPNACLALISWRELNKLDGGSWRYCILWFSQGIVCNQISPVQAIERKFFIWWNIYILKS